MTLITESIGTEALAFAALSVLVDSLNSEIDVVNASKSAFDQSVADKLETPEFKSITIEHVPAKHFHLGHKPTIVDMGVAAMPSVSCMAYDVQPIDMDMDMDQLDTNVVFMYCEIFVRGDNEHETNCRIQRVVEAADNLLRVKNVKLGGVVDGLHVRPTFSFTDCAQEISSEQDGTGNSVFWQACRIEYQYRTHKELF